MKNLISLSLAAFLLQATALAQSPAVPSDATKPVQEEQGVADTAEPRMPSHDLKLGAGTPVEIEAAYTVTSLTLRPNDYLSFRVLIPIRVDGVTVVERDALVTGRVVDARRGRHWGKAGRLLWTLVDVVAVDGSRIPLQAQKSVPNSQEGIKGTSHGAEVATRTIVMGALLAPVFPIAPLALMSGFRRGEDAILPQGKRFIVFVGADTFVKASGQR